MSAVQKILVADDSLTIRKLVESVLCQQGYEVITAETGADCIALATSQKPDLILLDYILPDKQGTELCRELINSPDTWEIPVLMMSSNGNAIRQLYHDLNNVADYLTKPFAPSVLTAVVGHLLQKDKPGQNGESSATTGLAVPAAVEAAASEPVVPQDFMDKVSRLITLMETKPAQESSAAGAIAADGAAGVEAKAAPAVAARAKARRARKPVVSVPAPDALLRKVRLALQKHLRLRIRQIPDWEAGLENSEPEAFLLDRLIAREVVGNIATELIRATGMPAEAAGALRCTVGLVPLDVILRHLRSTRATGELRIETNNEIVVALLQLGEIVFLSTNNPRSYCAGATCDFQSVPHIIIGEAVRAQEEQSVPFFISLQNSGHLPPGTSLEDLLVRQGKKCLVRAFKAAEATVSFFPLTRLPAMARGAKLSLPLNQWLLECYRSVDDWFTLERAFSEMEATFVPTPELDDQLQQLVLEDDEERMIEAVRPGRTMQELTAATDLKPFEVCRLLFRFVKLGLVRNGPRRNHDERVDDEIMAVAETPVIAQAQATVLPEVSPIGTPDANSEIVPATNPPGAADCVAETPEQFPPVEPPTPAETAASPVESNLASPENGAFPSQSASAATPVSEAAMSPV